MGIVPNGTDVTPRPAQLPAWDSLSPDRKRLYARYMEVYAAMLAYQDDQFGRLLDELERTGQLSNTLIVFIEGDNRSEEHTSELQSLMRISYAVFCLNKKTTKTNQIKKILRNTRSEHQKRTITTAYHTISSNTRNK